VQPPVALTAKQQRQPLVANEPRVRSFPRARAAACGGGGGGCCDGCGHRLIDHCGRHEHLGEAMESITQRWRWVVMCSDVRPGVE
jgi:hypothetical protein